MLQQLGDELTTLTPMAWVDIFRQRFTLRQQQQQEDLLSRLQPAIRADTLAFFANQLAATHLQDVPFSLTCKASKVGTTNSRLYSNRL